MPRRFSRCPVIALPGVRVVVARTLGARLLGLALLPAEAGPPGVLLPRTRSVHTFGMRFGLDLVWLDGAGRPVRVDCGVPPGRVRGCRAARAVLELPYGSSRTAVRTPRAAPA
jgi:uncharacterized membrane protein (UPF0127 family)